MESHIINPSEVAKLTGQERDDWFWDKLDALRQANVNLVDEVKMLKSDIEKRDFLLEKAKEDQKRHGQEIIEMGKQLNAARVAAANSVQEYIANTGR